MSPQAKSYLESDLFKITKQSHCRALVRASCDKTGVNHLRPKRHHKLIPARRAVSPHVQILIDTKAPFCIDQSYFVIGDFYTSGFGAQADVLLVHESENKEHPGGGCIRCIQVRDLENLVEDGLIKFHLVEKSATKL